MRSLGKVRSVKAQKVLMSTKSKPLNCIRRFKKIDYAGLQILKGEKNHVLGCRKEADCESLVLKMVWEKRNT